MLIRIANREDPDQIASSEAVDLGLCCLSRPFWQTSGDLHQKSVDLIIYIINCFHKSFISNFEKSMHTLVFI